MADEETPKRASLKDYAFYYAYKLLCLALRVMDVRLIAVIGRGVGYLVWAAFPGRRRIVERNLRIVLDPMLRHKKLAPMVRRNIVRTTMNLACSLKTGMMSAREMERSIRVEGGDVFEANGSGGHTVISCIPHAGNWEALARIRPLFSKVEHFGSMYRRLANPLLESFVYQSRTRYGCEMYSKEEGLRAVLKLARGGGLLGVLSDQYTAEGLYLPYFGKVTGVTPLPALLYRRCKGKGHLFSVFTRNTGLGRWDTVLGREIKLPENCESLADITMQVNLALEKCQRENILDGFWMHHRWKTIEKVNHVMEEDELKAIAAYARLPFRMIVCPPEEEEAIREMAPMVQVLKDFRPDAQISVVCSEARAAYWKANPAVTHIMTTDGPKSLREQFDADEVYKDGPFDMLFMLNRDKKLLGRFKFLFPLYVAGWKEHPLSRQFRSRYRRMEGCSGHPSLEEYKTVFYKHHHIKG